MAQWGLITPDLSSSDGIICEKKKTRLFFAKNVWKIVLGI